MGKKEWTDIKKVLKAGGFIFNDLFPIIAASYVTRKWEGDPLWILVVAPPGSGKTCAINLYVEAPDVKIVGAVTPASLISGWGGDMIDRSLLLELQSGQLLQAKDFGTILSMGSQQVAIVFGFLREAYDGYVSKHFGNCFREYKPKFNFIAATTEACEVVATFRAQLGERFLRFNYAGVRLPSPLPSVNPNLAGVVSGWMIEAEKEPRPSFSKADTSWLHAVAKVTAKLRTDVIHDSRSREVLEIPGFEGYARLEKQLTKLYGGLAIAIGDGTDARRLVKHTGLSSIKPRKVLVLQQIRRKPGVLSVNEIAENIRHGPTVVRRLLNDLYVLGLVERTQQGFPKTYTWNVEPKFNKELDFILPP